MFVFNDKRCLLCLYAKGMHKLINECLLIEGENKYYNLGH